MNTVPYKTELVLQRDMQSIIKTEAIIVRDETFITTDNSNGTVVSVAEDGKRVVTAILAHNMVTTSGHLVSAITMVSSISIGVTPTKVYTWLRPKTPEALGKNLYW